MIQNTVAISIEYEQLDVKCANYQLSQHQWICFGDLYAKLVKVVVVQP